MAIIGGGQIMSIIWNYRLVHLMGRFSGGKTSMAFYMAEYFLKKGYRLVSNTACIWNDDLQYVQLNEQNMLKAVFVLDEGGLFFKTSKEVERIASYAAKMDCVYLIPSFWPPTRSAQVVTVQPIFGFRSAGIPAIVYKWRVKLGAFEEKGWFLCWWPQSVFGLYSHQDPGDSPQKIIDLLVQRTDEYLGRYGHDHGLSAVEGEETDSLMLDAANTFAEAADAIQALPVRKAGRRR